ncbi:MAG: NUDIX hydrolase [Pseudomonadota bacterium]|nr:NUDIX hydrolase [Pseudomonadota bacterium]
MSAKARRAASIDNDGRRYQARPLVAIGIVIWRSDKVVLIRRSKPPRQGDWGLPGGVQEWGETIIEAAVREAREETSLDITPLGIITALDSLTRDDHGKVEFHYTIIDVAAEATEGVARAQSDAHEIRWATMDEVEQLCGWPEVSRIVRLSALQRAL